MFEKIIDLLMFRLPSEEDSSSSDPKVTEGSIIWGAILRSAILMLIIFLLLESLTMREYWWFMLFAIWFIAVYPAWLQWQKFNERMKTFTEQTLCGSCIQFDPTSQLCRLFDEHVSTNYIPCEGLNWEPVSKIPDEEQV
jgi:hypothetical protein